MLNPPDLGFSQKLSLNAFQRLVELWQQMAQTVGNESLVITEAVLARVNVPKKWLSQKFILIASSRFSGLLVGKSQIESSDLLPFFPPEGLLLVDLTFDSQAIASFLTELGDLFPANSSTHETLAVYLAKIQQNDVNLQTEFSLRLFHCLCPLINSHSTASDTAYVDYSVCQPVEAALKKQIDQERLLNQVTTQIRKSMDLSVIMTTSVEQVRNFLEVDRIVIYKFAESNSDNPSLSNYIACIVYEVLAHQNIPSVLHHREENCFTPTNKSWEKYRHGFTLAVDDIEKTYALESCLLDFFRTSKIRSKLAAPIVFEDKLWGLLIAHQCEIPRNWTESEKSLLTSVAEQLAIAIHQAELMRSLTQEKQTLEERVVERTMALHDALVAAEAASRVRSEFLATISHELLTPLTHVIGMSSTLLRWSFGELTPRQRDYLQRIHDSGEHLLEMIHDILELSQIEAGKAVLNITDFSLTDIVHRVIQELTAAAERTQVNLKIDLQILPEGDRFTADVRRVEQILWNLLSNAIKFTPQGGSVTLRVWIEDECAVFQVEDTGIGIPEDQLSELFEKFHQLDTPYRRRYEGTGLGLALTKQLVELHRGRIDVESTVDVGSIFTVWIPMQPNPVLTGE
ncbi:GAF domain-containing sensor histidine kinase [Calothrix sp. 336/3]|uniref:GAF domain-containing sensor histidine kinase n=1 Tax=Calothrix sp. 336/3 TaxID=1337936 RepID=UPI0004E2E1E9|nr:GAF domain-containing sensor histidine kinase [Calothrix sp. 336/3]AKG23732.1 ATPase [Calothrix sp. 336/3]